MIPWIVGLSVVDSASSATGQAGGVGGVEASRIPGNPDNTVCTCITFVPGTGGEVFKVFKRNAEGPTRSISPCNRPIPAQFSAELRFRTLYSSATCTLNFALQSRYVLAVPPRTLENFLQVRDAGCLCLAMAAACHPNERHRPRLRAPRSALLNMVNSRNQALLGTSCLGLSNY